MCNLPLLGDQLFGPGLDGSREFCGQDKSISSQEKNNLIRFFCGLPRRFQEDKAERPKKHWTGHQGKPWGVIINPPPSSTSNSKLLVGSGGGKIRVVPYKMKGHHLQCCLPLYNPGTLCIGVRLSPTRKVFAYTASRGPTQGECAVHLVSPLPPKFSPSFWGKASSLKRTGCLHYFLSGRPPPAGPVGSHALWTSTSSTSLATGARVV